MSFHETAEVGRFKPLGFPRAQRGHPRPPWLAVARSFPGFINRKELETAVQEAFVPGTVHRMTLVALKNIMSWHRSGEREVWGKSRPNILELMVFHSEICAEMYSRHVKVFRMAAAIPFLSVTLHNSSRRKQMSSGGTLLCSGRLVVGTTAVSMVEFSHPLCYFSSDFKCISQSLRIHFESGYR